MQYHVWAAKLFGGGPIDCTNSGFYPVIVSAEKSLFLKNRLAAVPPKFKKKPKNVLYDRASDHVQI